MKFAYILVAVGREAVIAVLVYSEVELRPVLHDGWARRGEARHSIWGWNDEAGDKGPIFTYGALADSCAMTAQSTMEDSLELSDSMEIEIVRYTLHDGEAKHDGKTRYGGEEVRQ